MKNDSMHKMTNIVHRIVLFVTRNRVGKSLGGMEIVELTTIGRRSGKEHAVMLGVAHRDDNRLVVVASRSGDDNQPAWYLNLLDNQQVKVRLIGGPSESRIARVATPEQRASMWPIIIEQFPDYGSFQDRTQREIPLVLLSPPD